MKPLFYKALLQETQGWWMELLTNVAMPLTFLLAFGLGLRNTIQAVDGVSYAMFLLPGLVAQTMLMEAYRAGTWGIWLDRWHQRMLDEYRIKPISTSDIIVSQILSGLVVGLVKGCITACILLAFVPLKDLNLAKILLFLAYVLPGGVLFTCLGTMVGCTVKKPDQIAQLQSICITPLLYLGGLFFPLHQLPQWLQHWVHWLPTAALFDGSRQALLHQQWSWHYQSLLLVSMGILFLLAVRTFNRQLSD